MACGAKLAVLLGDGDLAEHALVEVAFDVTVGHIDVVEQFYEEKHVVTHCLEHLLGGELLKARPAELVLTGSEDRFLGGLLGASRLDLLGKYVTRPGA